MLIILISSSGFSLYTLVFSILCTTSMPAMARPKIVCLLSSHGYIARNKLAARLLSRGGGDLHHICNMICWREARITAKGSARGLYLPSSLL